MDQDFSSRLLIGFELTVNTEQDYEFVAQELGVQVANKMWNACHSAGTPQERRVLCLDILNEVVHNGSPRTKGAGARPATRTVI